MRKMKGFTLIELLAVIVILAIIAVIATPLAINVINSSKEKSFVNSVYGLIDGARLLSAEQVFNDGSNEVEVHFTDGTASNNKFKVSGDMPTSGTVRINSDGRVELKVWSSDLGKCAEKSVTEAEVKLTDTPLEECTIGGVIGSGNGKTFTEVMNGNSEVSDHDPDQNLRYVGADPDNYVLFNNELWRIIGVFDGQAKIIRNDAYSNSLAWNDEAADCYYDEDYGEDVCDYYNDWEVASLQKELNGTYLSSIQSNDPVSYGFIDLDHVWNLGAHSSYYLTRSEFYEAERSDIPAHDGTETIWIGAVGLMYPSDYGYSSSGSNEVCDAVYMFGWNQDESNFESYSDYFDSYEKFLQYSAGKRCRDYSWLIYSNEWLLTSKSDDSEVFWMYDDIVISDSPEFYFGVRPVVYLKNDVRIYGGAGTSVDPYILDSSENKDMVIVATPEKMYGGEDIYVSDKEVVINVGTILSGERTLSNFVYKLNDGDEQVVVDNQIVLNISGEYTIELIATDSENNVVSKIIGPFFVDSTPPTITFEEGDTAGISVEGVFVDSFDLYSGVIVDDEWVSLGTNGDLSAIPGKYEIIYEAEDSASNVSTKVRNVTVYCPSRTIMGKTVLCETLANDPDGNIRYVGKNPNNYVWFNNELWRIVGVFDGQTKIVREQYYGDGIAWDTNNKNDFATDSLQLELNGYNFLGSMDSQSYSYIDLNHEWNIGGTGDYYLTRSEFYAAERGETISSSMTSHLWTGAIGLLYPSDYGYSTNYDPTVCDSDIMYSWDCDNGSWLYDRYNAHQWTLTASSRYSDDVYTFDRINNLSYASSDYSSSAGTSIRARPALYLKESIKIASGAGSSEDPYILYDEENDNPVVSLKPYKTSKPEQEVTIDVDVLLSVGNTISSLVYKMNGGAEQIVNDNQIIINTEGQNVIEVIATDNKGNVTSYTSGIYNVDRTSPVITFEEGDNEGISINGASLGGYDLKTGLSISDNNEISLDSVTVTGDLSAVLGEYNVTYEAIDQAGNVTTKKRNIKITCDSASIMGKTVMCQTLAIDPDSNVRYVGKNPNNYVWFNNELWRIVGIFDGQAKITRNKYYYSPVSWNEDGKNDWTISTFNNFFNNTYLENIQINDPISYSYIDLNHEWYLGGFDYNSSLTRTEIYSAERSESISSIMTNHLWNGAIGLIYPSDYLYSSNGDEHVCEVVELEKCIAYSWLYDKVNYSYNLLTMTPDIGNDYYVISVNGEEGWFSSTYARSSDGSYPTLYLKSGVKIVDGVGTYDDPYRLSM